MTQSGVGESGADGYFAARRGVETGEGDPDMSISASAARRGLIPLRQVDTDHEPVRTTSNADDAVFMSADDYNSWPETVDWLRSPENAEQPTEAVAHGRAGHSGITTSVDELRDMAGGQE